MADYITVDHILAACSNGRGRTGRDGGMCFCPAHDDRKSPSLSVRRGDKQPIIVKCFTGCEFDDIRDALEQRIGLPWPPMEVERPKSARGPRTKPEAIEARIRERMAELGALAAVKGTMAERYLQGRGIGAYANSRAFLYAPAFGRRPAALVSLICSVRTGRVQSYLTTFLHKDHVTGGVVKARATADRPAKLLAKGFKCEGGVIPLNGFDDPPDIVIAEGMETAASAGLRFGLPAWAAVSAGNLRRLILPAHVRSVIIAADNDASGTGLDAAYEAAVRWQNAGTAVRIIMPDREDTDFNDYAD